MKTTFRTLTRISRIVKQVSPPGVAIADRSQSFRSWSSEVRCQFVMSGQANPGFGHLDGGLPLEDVEQHADPLPPRQPALHDRAEAAQRPVGDFELGPGGKRIRTDD